MNLNEFMEKADMVTRGTTPQVPVMRSLYAGAVYMVSDHQRELWVCCLFMSSSPDKTTPEGGRQEFKLPQKGNKDPHSSLLPWRRIILAKSRLRGLSWELEPGLLFHVSCYCPFSERESTNISPSGRSAPCVGDTNGIYFCDPHY